MYHAIFPDGRIECQRYETSDDGVELYDGDDDQIAFIPFENLHALIDEDVHADEEGDIPWVM